MNLESYISNLGKHKEDPLKNKVDEFNDLVEILCQKEVISLSDYQFITSFSKSKNILQLRRYKTLISKLDIPDPNMKKKFNELSDILFGNLKLDIRRMIKFYGDFFVLTGKQRIAMEKLMEFMTSDSTIFGLYGYAGTGKTTAIVRFMQYLIYDDLVKSIALVAPTNKAVNVIKSKFSDGIHFLLNKKFGVDVTTNPLDVLRENKFRIEFLTIHRLLNYKNNYQMSGQKVFVRGKKNKIDKFSLIIIDECSMLSLQILMDLHDEINKQKNGVKIVFLGDPAQLPPVNEKSSLVFTENRKQFDYKNFKDVYIGERKNIDFQDTVIKEKYNNFQEFILTIPTYTLDQIVRTNDENIIQLCNEIRKFVLGEIDVPKFNKFKKSKKIHLYKYDKTINKTDTLWFSKYIEYISESSSQNSNIILSWTNKQTDNYNDNVRYVIYNDKEIEKYEVGDVLIMSEFYSIKDTDNYDDNKFYTSEQIKVVKINRTVKNIPRLTENLDNKTSRIKNIHDIREKYLRAIKTINKNIKRKYNVWKITVVKLNVDSNKDEKEYSIYVIDESSVSAIESDIEITRSKIKELVSYYNSVHRENICTIDNMIISKLWKEFNNKFIDPFAQINYGFSITVHKSQASTFYNVFVDLHDIFKNKNSEEAKKCLYTAVTRTSNELHILI